MRCASLILLLLLVFSARPAQAMDGPFTWEEVICRADAVAEIEMVLATKTTPDRMEVRRVFWNRTKHRIRANYGHPDIPTVTNTRFKLLAALAAHRKDHHDGVPAEFVGRYRRALERGSYRTILILQYFNGEWDGGGWVYDGVEWLDHPKHAEWWAKVQPYLRQYIEASKRHEKPAFCADVSVKASHLKVTPAADWAP